MTKLSMIAAVLLVVLGVASCTDAEIASANVSRAADQFEVFRRVVFYNGITGEYMLVVEGFCSIAIDADRDVALTVKDRGRYLKHYMHLSDNVTYFAEQLAGVDASTARYRVIFKPSAILPDIELH